MAIGETPPELSVGNNPLAQKPSANRFPNLIVIPVNDQIIELQTIIRDKTTTRSDFVFYADRLIRLVVEEGLNQLPHKDIAVTTPTEAQYQGLQYLKGNCGVSIVRSGEAMEKGLRDCCRSIRIGKILVQSDEDTHEARVVYAKFPDDIAERKVLLMYPIMSTGNTVVKAVKVLMEHGVRHNNIILLNLFCTPNCTQPRPSTVLIIISFDSRVFGGQDFSLAYDIDLRGESRGAKPFRTEIFRHRLK